MSRPRLTKPVPRYLEFSVFESQWNPTDTSLSHCSKGEACMHFMAKASLSLCLVFFGHVQVGGPSTPHEGFASVQYQFRVGRMRMWTTNYVSMRRASRVCLPWWRSELSQARCSDLAHLGLFRPEPFIACTGRLQSRPFPLTTAGQMPQGSTSPRPQLVALPHAPSGTLLASTTVGPPASSRRPTRWPKKAVH